MTESYLEKCIAALPPHKQSAARAACQDLLEGTANDHLLSRLLVVLEATSAYGEKIPKGIVAASEHHLAALETKLAHAQQISSEAEKQRLDKFSAVVREQLPQMAKELSSARHANAVEALGQGIARLERSVSRMRHVRLGAVTVLIVLAAMAGAAGLGFWFKADFEAGQRAREHFSILQSYGVQTRLLEGEHGGLRVVITGPAVSSGSGWKRNARNEVTGAELNFPNP